MAVHLNKKGQPINLSDSAKDTLKSPIVSPVRKVVRKAVLIPTTKPSSAIVPAGTDPKVLTDHTYTTSTSVARARPGYVSEDNSNSSTGSETLDQDEEEVSDLEDVMRIGAPKRQKTSNNTKEVTVQKTIPQSANKTLNTASQEVVIYEPNEGETADNTEICVNNLTEEELVIYEQNGAQVQVSLEDMEEEDDDEEEEVDEDEDEWTPGSEKKPKVERDADLNESSRSSNVTASGQKKRRTKFECTVCEEVFKKAADLRKHAKKHVENRPFACEECGKTFVKRKNLTAHMLVHVELKPFECPECSKCFAIQHRLKAHMELHNRPQITEVLANVQGKLRCPICANVSGDFESFKNHVFMKHADSGVVKKVSGIDWGLNVVKKVQVGLLS